MKYRIVRVTEFTGDHYEIEEKLSFLWWKWWSPLKDQGYESYTIMRFQTYGNARLYVKMLNHTDKREVLELNETI